MRRSGPWIKKFRVVAAALALAAFSPSLLAENEQTGFHLFAAGAPSLAVSDEAPLLTVAEQSAPPPPAADQNPPPPGTNPTLPSLEDLGFTSEQSRADVEAQARLDKRTHMLKIHQCLGLITIVPLLATVITASNATKKGTSADRNLHAALGLVTAAMYVTAASYAIRAPSLGTETRGPIRLHKALAWIHGIGMILTPILGAMARSQLDSGEKVHGIASAHSTVAAITVGAYAAAIGAVAIKF